MRIITIVIRSKIYLKNRTKLKGEIKQDVAANQVADMICVVYYGVLQSIQSKFIGEVSEPKVRDMIRVLIAGIDRYCKE